MSVVKLEYKAALEGQDFKPSFPIKSKHKKAVRCTAFLCFGCHSIIYSMTQALTRQKLYERDLNLWFEETLDCLRSRDLQNLDIEALIEEIEGLAGRDRREIKSFWEKSDRL